MPFSADSSFDPASGSSDALIGSAVGDEINAADSKGVDRFGALSFAGIEGQAALTDATVLTAVGVIPTAMVLFDTGEITRDRVAQNSRKNLSRATLGLEMA